MFGHTRQSQILDYLRKHPSSSVTQLQIKLGVSRSTLRRDLVELEEQGAIVRVHGGVVHRDSLRGEPTYDRRGREATQAKRRIAAAAAALVPEGCVVYLDAGTTCAELGRLLAVRKDIRIFTHSVRLLIEVGESAASLTCLGGEYRPVSQAVVGGLALDWLSHLHFDFGFIGASGLDAETGASTTELSEAALKQAIVERSDRVILAADARKWEKPAAVNFAGWQSIHTLVTDEAPARSHRRSLADRDTEVVVAAIES